MTNIEINNFEKNIHGLLKQTLETEDILKVSTPTGNAIILPESYYNSLIETFYFYDTNKMKEKVDETQQS